jgi:hypothetical protein
MTTPPLKVMIPSRASSTQSPLHQIYSTLHTLRGHITTIYRPQTHHMCSKRENEDEISTLNGG